MFYIRQISYWYVYVYYHVYYETFRLFWFCKYENCNRNLKSKRQKIWLISPRISCYHENSHEIACINKHEIIHRENLKNLPYTWVIIFLKHTILSLSKLLNRLHQPRLLPQKMKNMFIILLLC